MRANSIFSSTSMQVDNVKITDPVFLKKRGNPMFKECLLCAALILALSPAHGETLQASPSNIKLNVVDGVENEDLMNVLRFQNIHLSKMKFTGTHLWGKNFKIFIRDFVNGKLIKNHEVFDSREEEFFKVKEQEFTFSVLVQRTLDNKAKFDIRFLGYGVVKEFDVSPSQRDFALKNFQGGAAEIAIPVNVRQPFLAFMMPYRAANGSTHYSDVVHSGIKPEDLGKKFGIPRYFLMDIQFE